MVAEWIDISITNEVLSAKEVALHFGLWAIAVFPCSTHHCFSHVGLDANDVEYFYVGIIIFN